MSFVDAFVEGLLNQYKDNPDQITRTLILLPTRRSCRVLRDSFLKLTEGKPLMLPRMCPFSDVDEEEIFISAHGNNVIDIPPAMSALERQILLARTISKLPDFSKTPDQDMALAKMLGQLMDEIYTEDLDLKDLAKLVDVENLQKHWNITLEFLTILSEVWPSILAEKGKIDAADRRNRLLNALRTHWENHPPNHPVIAAGSTGSIPATALLLKEIANQEQGSVVLPALDQNLSEDIWLEIEDGHPQATLKKLLDEIDVSRKDVQLWSAAKDISEDKKSREQFLSYLMYPAEKTNEWQGISYESADIKRLEDNLTNITSYECHTANEEANLIAVLLREVLEEPKKTAAVVTSDRNLARRVAMMCKRWGITVDDSGGDKLSESPLGQYFRLSGMTCLNALSPVPLLALLKHDMCRGNGFENYRDAVRVLEHDLLRGLKPESGFEGLYKRLSEKQEKIASFEDINEFVTHIEKSFTPLLTIMKEGFHPFINILDTHIELIENLANTGERLGEEILWSGEAGESLANFLSELREHASQFPDVTGQSYFDIMEQLLSTVMIRPKFGMHPRVSILGQLEARLLQADRVILAGLNENSWPSDPKHDPWMSRPMRKSFGLPLPEQSIGLSAHDFVQGISAHEVFITRAQKIDGTPTVPARWMQRFDTLLDTIGIERTVIRKGPHLKYVEHLNKCEQLPAMERPAPRPPVEVRPRKLSVTRIETWLQDPYSIYAKSILKLKKLDPLEKLPEASEKGTLLHDILERFMKAHTNILPEDAEFQFIQLSKDVLAEQQNADDTLWHFWQPRMNRLANWVVAHEAQHRMVAGIQKLEADGEIIFTPEKDKVENAFTLTARADRIDKKYHGGGVIIDYKSGGSFNPKGMISGKNPQLPLEALILESKGFEGVNEDKVACLSYWKLTGGREEGSVTSLDDASKLEEALVNAQDGMVNLIRAFDKPDTAYFSIPNLDNAPRFNDYEHLARVKEWTALGEDSESEAA